ncbi:MAG: VanZ family protein, partial [Gammaproteobacteria bacterium]
AARSSPGYGTPDPRLRRAWAVIGWALVFLTIVLSLQPSPVAFAGGNLDKLMHVLTYATLTLWFIQLAPAERWIRIALWFVGMGVAIEIAQDQTAYRYCSFADMVANATGIVTALLAARYGLSNLLTRCETMLARTVPAPAPVDAPVDPPAGPGVRDEG